MLYTLHDIETGDVIQAGDVPNADCLPNIPDGAMITEGFMAIRGEERVINGERVYYVRDREPEELLAAIERERARRLTTGFDYNFNDERGVHRIGTTYADDIGWDKVTKLAGALIAAGSPGTQIAIVTDTGPVLISAMEWQHVLIAAGQFQQPIYAASFQVQAMNPIPQDVENSTYWNIQ